MAHPEPAGEEEEHHGSPWPVIIAVGMGVGYVGIVSASVPMLLVGVVIFGGGAGGWIHQDMQEPSSAFYGLATSVESRFPRVSARKLGTWLFLATEIMFFSAIIGSSFTLRLRTGTPGLATFQGPWASSPWRTSRGRRSRADSRRRITRPSNSSASIGTLSTSCGSSSSRSSIWSEVTTPGRNGRSETGPCDRRDDSASTVHPGLRGT